MRYTRCFCLLLFILLTGLSCKKAEIIEDPGSELFQVADAFERSVFQKIRAVADEATRVWPGYDYPISYPIYLIFTDNSGAFVSGYLINPPEEEIPKEAREVDDQNAAGLNLYRYDEGLAEAEFRMGEQIFFLSITFGNTEYFTLREHHQTDNFYLNYKNQDDNNMALALTHELFHYYQFGPGQFQIDNYIQDRNNYPLDEQSIAAHLLLSEIMSQAYSIEDMAEQEEYLDYFTAILEELVNSDPSSQQLVQNYALKAAMIEGSARYVEVYAAQPTIYPGINTDPTHGWSEEIRTTTDANQVRNYLAFRMWYHVGAIAIKMLIDQGIDVAAGFRNGETPYDQALARHNYTVEELATLRETARTLVDNETIQAEASRLYQLLQ